MTGSKLGFCVVGAFALGLIAFSVTAKTPTAAKTKRPKTKAELVKRGLAAIQNNDAAAFIALTFTLDDIKKHCPDMAETFCHADQHFYFHISILPLLQPSLYIWHCRTLS